MDKIFKPLAQLKQELALGLAISLGEFEHRYQTWPGGNGELDRVEPRVLNDKDAADPRPRPKV